MMAGLRGSASLPALKTDPGSLSPIADQIGELFAQSSRSPMNSPKVLRPPADDEPTFLMAGDMFSELRQKDPDEVASQVKKKSERRSKQSQADSRSGDDDSTMSPALRAIRMGMSPAMAARMSSERETQQRSDDYGDALASHPDLGGGGGGGNGNGGGSRGGNGGGGGGGGVTGGMEAGAAGAAAAAAAMAARPCSARRCWAPPAR